MIYKVKKPSTIDEWENYYLLRWRILRKNLGMKKGSEKDDLEPVSIHRMIKRENDVIGVARLHFENKLEGQIRFLAVDRKFRKLGLGRLLMNELILIAKKQQIERIFLNSRYSAIGFYLKLVFEKIKRTDKKFDIIHFLMEKKL